MDNVTHYIKVREKGKKAWAFLSSKGNTNRLRVHAVMFPKDRALLVATEIMAENAEWQAKIVPIGGR